MGNAGPVGRYSLIGIFLSVCHEVDELAHEPHEGVADEVFLHHVFAFGVAAFCGVAWDNEAIDVDEKTSFSPQGEILGVESCMCLVDD